MVNAIAVMHELQNDIARWARDYEAAHVYMGEHPNVTIAAIRGGAPWRLSRNPHSCSLYLDIRTVPGQTVDGVKRDLRRVLRALRASARARPSPICTSMSAIRRPCSTRSCRSSRRSAPRRRTVTGERPPTIIRRPGADAVHLTAYGVPCVAFGPGGRMHPDARGASMHAFGEHVLVERLRRGRENLSRHGARPVQPQGAMMREWLRFQQAEPHR